MPCDLMRVLEKPFSSRLRVLVASATLLLSPIAAFAGDTDIHPGFAGIYVARVDKKAPSMSVSLGVDGTATVTEDPGTGAITAFGHWANEGTQIKVTFNADADQPTEPPMVFQVVHNKLQPVTWNHQEWGAAQPPTMTKGYKVKYLFWTTTMRQVLVLLWFTSKRGALQPEAPRLRINTSITIRARLDYDWSEWAWEKVSLCALCDIYWSQKVH